MNIYYGLTILEFVGLIIGGITLVVLLVYYGISAVIRKWKSRRIERCSKCKQIGSHLRGCPVGIANRPRK